MGNGIQRRRKFQCLSRTSFKDGKKRPAGWTSQIVFGINPTKIEITSYKDVLWDGKGDVKDVLGPSSGKQSNKLWGFDETYVIC
jgi:hypothetical protein